MTRTVYMVWELEPKTPVMSEHVKKVFSNRIHAKKFASELQQYALPGTEYLVIPLILEES